MSFWSDYNCNRYDPDSHENRIVCDSEYVTEKELSDAKDLIIETTKEYADQYTVDQAKEHAEALQTAFENEFNERADTFENGIDTRVTAVENAETVHGATVSAELSGFEARVTATESVAGTASTDAANAVATANDAKEIAELNSARLDTAINAVTTDTEVTDIRVGVDGKTYSTAGNAVRNQINEVFDGIYKKINLEVEIGVNRYLSGDKILKNNNSKRASVAPFEIDYNTIILINHNYPKIVIYGETNEAWAVIYNSDVEEIKAVDVSNCGRLCIQISSNTDISLDETAFFDTYGSNEKNIKELNNAAFKACDINTPDSWTLGGIGSNGEDFNRVGSIRSDYLYKNVTSLEIEEGYAVTYVAFYDENGNLKKRDTEITKNSYTLKRWFANNPTYYKFRFELIKLKPDGTKDDSAIADTSRSVNVKIYSTTDTHLNKYGAAADAKVVGDLLTNNTEKENLVSQANFSFNENDNILTLVHCSDIHNNINSMRDLLIEKAKYTSISDIIHTGDTVTANYSDGIQNWIDSGCAEIVLNVLGNHDTAVNLTTAAANKSQVYGTFIAPYIDDWDIVQPTGVTDVNSDHYCACYYYKDYASKNIRLIVIDDNYWNDAQMTWLENTLADALTNEYSVILASHVCGTKTTGVTGIKCNWTSYNYGEITPSASYTKLTDDALTAIDNFINAGGDFVIWIGGHSHCDIFGYVNDHENILTYSIDKASVSRCRDGARIANTISQNCFNLMSIDTTVKLIKFTRIGFNVDGMLRPKNAFCYNYETKEIITQW